MSNNYGVVGWTREVLCCVSLGFKYKRQLMLWYCLNFAYGFSIRVFHCHTSDLTTKVLIYFFNVC